MTRIMNSSDTALREPRQDEDGTWGAGTWTRRLLGIGLVACSLALVTAAAFLPVLHNDFLNWDDQENFVRNYGFRGLGAYQIRWAWTAMVLGVYQPLAWMLLGAQYALWGMDPMGYHATSLALHAVNTVTLYALAVTLLDRCLPRAVGADRNAVHGASALAVLLFATNPLRVEAVAWVSCQPYLPCALLSMLSVLAYVCSFGPRAGGSGGVVGRVFAWVLLAGALLCKAPAVTVPAVLVILDVYPLRRLGPGRWTGPDARRVWLEKVPFFGLSLAFMTLALKAKDVYGTLRVVDEHRFGARVLQACYGICFYLVKTVAPTGLSAFYPLPERMVLSDWPYWACVLAVVAISVGAVLLRRRWPGLLAAWLSYVVILAPNLGLIRIGNQIAADRYCYMALIGPVILLGSGLALLVHQVRRPAVRAGLLAAGLGIVSVESVLSWRQCLTWRTSEALWTNALALADRRCPTIILSLGNVRFEEGKLEEARAYFEEVIRLAPDNSTAFYNIGRVLYDQGENDEAEAYFAKALRLRPDYADASYNLGVINAARGELDRAAVYYRRAIRIRPEDPAAHNNLGVVLLAQGRLKAAEREFHESLRLRPGYQRPRLGLDAVRRAQVRDRAISPS